MMTPFMHPNEVGFRRRLGWTPDKMFPSWRLLHDGSPPSIEILMSREAAERSPRKDLLKDLFEM